MVKTRQMASLHRSIMQSAMTQASWTQRPCEAQKTASKLSIMMMRSCSSAARWRTRRLASRKLTLQTHYKWEDPSNGSRLTSPASTLRIAGQPSKKRKNRRKSLTSLSSCRIRRSAKCQNHKQDTQKTGKYSSVIKTFE